MQLHLLEFYQPHVGHASASSIQLRVNLVGKEEIVMCLKLESLLFSTSSNRISSPPRVCPLALAKDCLLIPESQQSISSAVFQRVFPPASDFLKSKGASSSAQVLCGHSSKPAPYRSSDRARSILKNILSFSHQDGVQVGNTNLYQKRNI